MRKILVLLSIILCSFSSNSKPFIPTEVVKPANVVVLKYQDMAAGSAKITRLKIKNSAGVVVYDFNEAALIAGQEIAAGNYIFEITTQGGPAYTWGGWGSVEMRFSSPIGGGAIIDNNGSTVYTTAEIQTTSALLELFIYTEYA
ncbi:hypothetical protein [Pedobacter gandavensis]|uniref:hypothetical protein n=1 Tax=Pedobacter gandavensis TaxID=2679963 RepID=UPI00292FA690|nr:hypothetical protein [Pedobacter gandavensis]